MSTHPGKRRRLSHTSFDGPHFVWLDAVFYRDCPAGFQKKVVQAIEAHADTDVLPKTARPPIQVKKNKKIIYIYIYIY